MANHPYSSTPAYQPDDNWQASALCAQTDPALFFPDAGGNTNAAKRICRTCPVQAECLDWEDRFLLKGLESYVDDNGVGKDDVALIVSDVFPHDMYVSPQETAVRVQTAIGVLNQAGLVWRYEADGTDLLFVSWWDTTQLINRPSKGRFRRPDGTWNYRDSEITGCTNPPENQEEGD